MLTIVSFAAMAQSGRQWVTSRVDENPFVSMLPDDSRPTDAWLGGDLTYEFGNNNLEDAFLLNAQVLLEIETGTELHLPIMSTVEFSSVETFSSLDLGLFPWQSLSNTIAAHGGVEFSSDGELENYQLRILGGFEAAFATKYLPLTISVAPTFTLFNNNRESDVGVEAVVIVPVANGLGVLFQGALSFTSDQRTFGAGIVARGIL